VYGGIVMARVCIDCQECMEYNLYVRTEGASGCRGVDMSQCPIDCHAIVRITQTIPDPGDADGEQTIH
jgi:hypothetical protein